MQKIMRWFNVNRNNIANVVFYIALSLELLIMMVGHSAFELPYTGRITHVAFVLFGFKILLTKYTKTEWIVIVLLGIIGTLSYATIRDEWFIRIVVLIVSSKNISQKDIIKYIFWVSLIGTCIIIGLCLIGIGGPRVDVRDYGRGGIEERWCLGFNHANNVHGTIWYVMSLGLLGYLQKTRWYHYLLLTILNTGLYALTISRSGFIVTQLVIIAMLVYRYYPQIAKWKWVYIAGIPTTIFCAGIGIYTVVVGIEQNPILQKMSSLLTGRLELLTWWEKIEYWTLFGSDRDRKPTDVGYITLVSRYGYVIFVLSLMVTLILIFCYCKEQKWMEYVLLITCVFYTFMESTYTINVPLLCNLEFVLLLGTWDCWLTKGRQNESVQSEA